MSFSSTASLFDLFELWLITDSEWEGEVGIHQLSTPFGGTPTIPHADCDTTANSLLSTRDVI